MNKFKIILIIIAGILTTQQLSAQRVGFINSETIREKFPDAKQAEQRLESIVEEWKREIRSMQERIDQLEFEIKKNRLIWSDQERQEKERQLKELKDKKRKFATERFEPGGEYDKTVKMIQQPVEAKIYAAVQKVSAEEGFDIVWDQSIQPMAYVNFKYDLTVKVLKELGVDTQKLEADLKQKIENDPRNKRDESKSPRRKIRRGRRYSPDDDKNN